MTNVYQIQMKKKVLVKHFHISIESIGQNGRLQMLTGPKTKE
jgi:hypothetical protein